ncbi:hypothetical protein [Natronosalvus rutilus]|uniref:Uncharacterized protein n=1 Tax=Natronosalvus rutilus TaxID=2953753 RepID=A0A9E7NAG5_9EURY|nr:hypothetical protein [Natronosalvus rutilus]UTF54764.1 hypothetical protein NGM29_05705 [Natronosalvus rutilus]
MLDTPRVRLFALGILLLAFVGLFVAYGALEPDPALHDYPGDEELAIDYDRYVGQQVDIGGTVIATDPLTIEVDHEHGTDTYVIRNGPETAVGQDLRVFGTVRPDGELLAQETIVQERWELAYMYLVSLLAAGWLVVRALRHWRVDPQALAVIPHKEDADA